MTTPEYPYGNPEQSPPPPPGYGTPQYGQQPPAYGAPQYGAPAPYGQAPYGAPPAGNFGGTLANWPMRVASALIDAIIPAIISIVTQAAASLALTSVLSLVSLGYWIWNLWRQGTTGQTIGKSVVGTHLVRESDGQFVGGGLSILRAIVHIVDFVPCLVGYLWPIWDSKKQTFADKIMSTVVVKR